jgi:pilus assembly protein CpaF
LGIDQNGRSFGEFIATGVRPSFMDRLETAGYNLTPDVFRQRVLLKD